MGFFKKLFGKENNDRQQHEYEEQPYTEEQYEYYDEQQSLLEQEYQAYDTPEEPVQRVQPKQQVPQQPPLEDVYNEVYEAPETKSPYFQDYEVQVRPSYEKPPADFNPFGHRPNGLIGTVPRVSREQFNPFTENGIAPEPVTPRRKPQPMTPRTSQPTPTPRVAREQPTPVVPTPIEEKKSPRYIAPKQSFSNEEPVQKKKFEPRLVPSPIYGFQEPPKRPIVTVEHVEAQRERVRTLNDKKVEVKSSEALAEEWEQRHPELNAIAEQQTEVVAEEVQPAPVVETVEATSNVAEQHAPTTPLVNDTEETVTEVVTALEVE